MRGHRRSTGPKLKIMGDYLEDREETGQNLRPERTLKGVGRVGLIRKVPKVSWSET